MFLSKKLAILLFGADAKLGNDPQMFKDANNESRVNTFCINEKPLLEYRSVDGMLVEICRHLISLKNRLDTLSAVVKADTPIKELCPPTSTKAKKPSKKSKRTLKRA